MATDKDKQDRVKVERVGGFGGFGLPGSRIKSKGEMALSKMSAADQRALQALFDGKVRATAPKPDAFTYRLTRHVGKAPKTIEVTEDQVPEAIRRCVKDTLT